MLVSADYKGLRGALRQSQAGRREREAVESRKLKVEGQPKGRRIQDAEHTELTQRGGLQWATAGIPRGSGQVVATYQRTYYHMITVPVK